MKQPDDHQAGASTGASGPDVGNAAAARADMALSEHFERWWRHHPLQRQASLDDDLASMLPGYEQIARSAWNNALGMVPTATRDDRIERLQRRCGFLRNRIFNNRPLECGHDKGELAALEWAISIVIRVTDAPASPEPAQDAGSTGED